MYVSQEFERERERDKGRELCSRCGLESYKLKNVTFSHGGGCTYPVDRISRVKMAKFRK